MLSSACAASAETAGQAIETCHATSKGVKCYISNSIESGLNPKDGGAIRPAPVEPRCPGAGHVR